MTRSDGLTVLAFGLCLLAAICDPNQWEVSDGLNYAAGVVAGIWLVSTWERKK